MKRPELRKPVLHPKLLVYELEKLNHPPGLDDEKSRDGVTSAVAESPSGKCSVNALVNQIQNTNSTMNRRNQVLTQQIADV